MTEFMTWELLATYSGAILAVTLITQFVKGVGFIDAIPTRFVSYVIAVVVLILANVFTGEFSLSTAILSLINGVLVSLAANGTYDLCTTKPEDNSTLD